MSTATFLEVPAGQMSNYRTTSEGLTMSPKLETEPMVIRNPKTPALR